jgi:hypothetical protein
VGAFGGVPQVTKALVAMTSEAKAATDAANQAAAAVAKLKAAGGGPDTLGQGDYVDSQLAKLTKVADDLARLGGADASGKYGFATILKDQIDKVKNHQETILEALSELRRQFGSVYGVIQKQMLNPDTNPDLRALDQWLLTFINGGMV